MMRATTLSCFIQRKADELYEEFWRPEQFPKWASGLAQASLHESPQGWKAQGPDGPVTITFSGHNSFGVMDHWVDQGDSNVIFIPLRIIANGDGSEVMLTLFQQPGMTDEMFLRDQQWVERDLRALKALAERS